MTSAFALPMPSVISDLIARKTIPALDGAQLTATTDYLFKRANTPLRLEVAEIAYRNHGHPNAQDLFLSCTMPLAQKWTERRAYRLFVYPSDWQLECLYNGAVCALLKTFARHFPLRSTPDSFRRFLAYRFACGATEAYFTRYENSRMDTVPSLELIAPRSAPSHNAVEQELITRELLEQITHYPLLQRALSKTLQCITELGPDKAIKEHRCKESRDPERSKSVRKLKPMLNAEAIAKVRGIRPSTVLLQIHLARKILRKAFNGDGRLFLTH
jgi:hypothetical protein